MSYETREERKNKIIASKVASKREMVQELGFQLVQELDPNKLTDWVIVSDLNFRIKNLYREIEKLSQSI